MGQNFIRINPSDSEWKFLEKNQDSTCTIKITKTNEEIEGKITAISSNGFYTIEIFKKTDFTIKPAQ
jgi:hypothetical protein